MTALQQLLRSTVNTWECDEMGHLNVRHYPAHAGDAVRILLGSCGLTPTALRGRQQRLRFLEKHMRFHRELRPGTAFAAFGGFLETDKDGLTTYCELRRARDGVLAATILGRVGLCRAGTSEPLEFDAACLGAADGCRVELPPHGAARGVERAAPRPVPVLQDAVAMGMAGEYLGVADPVHVDADGFVEPAGHVSRISDGIQHFFLTIDGPRPEGIGGAVLEFRLVSHAEASAGDLIEVRSGLKHVGRKARHFCHWVFDASTGNCLATAEAVAVAFDLEKRRATEFTAESRERMLELVVPGLSI